MSATEIKQFVFGFTMSGEYASGQSWAERFNKDGTSSYSENGKYDENPTVSGGCFEVWKRGANCFDFYSTNADQPAASLDQRRFGRGWDARAWYADQKSTCLSEEIS